MKGRPSVWTRLRRLDAAGSPDGIAAATRVVAAELGVDPAELAAEAAALAVRCREAGATTVPEQAVFLTAELGVTPHELLAEARRLAAFR